MSSHSITLVAFIGAAAIGLTMVPEADAQQTPDTAASALVQQGAEVYSRHCQRCHVPRSPRERDDRGWIIIMHHMQARANLTRDHARAALAFLLASNGSAASGETPTAGDRADLTRDDITDAMIREGREVYHGPGGCAACHGEDLGGGPIAPSLADDAWKNGNGSPAAILQVVRTGVDGTAMAALAGGISDEQARRVAAYVWAVSQGRASP